MMILYYKMLLNISYMLLEVEAEEEEEEVLVIVTTEMILKMKRTYSRVLLAYVKGSSRRTWKPRNQRCDRYKVQCFYCNKFGHFANKCWKKQADNSKLSTHMVEEIGNEEHPMFLNCNVNQESSKDIWFLTVHVATT